MKFRKAAASLLAVSMAAMMPVSANAAIIGADTDAPNTTKTDETIVVTLASEPAYLWGAPKGETANETQIISSALYDTLVKTDKATGEVLPNLATAWEWVDGTHCKYTLRDDVMMKDGTPLCAEDVAYTVGVWMECSPNSDTGRFLAGAEVVDDQTVIVEYNVEAPDLVSMMSWSNFGIVCEADVEAAGGLEQAAVNPVIGSGKYNFVEWKTGQYVTLERNDNYWNPDYTGYFKTITIKFTNDAAAREMAVESGDSNCAVDMPVVQAAAYAGNEAVNIPVYDFGQVTHLWMNMTEGRATADQKVREAIAKAINYDALAAVGTANIGSKALGYFSSNSPYYTEMYSAEEKVQDIEGAKALLAEAGYENGLTLEIIGTQDSTPTYTVLQANLAEAGITLNINTMDTPSFVMASAIEANFDLVVVGEWVPNRNPSMFVFFDEDAAFCIGGPRAHDGVLEGTDDLVEAIIAESDEAKAKEMIDQLMTTVKEGAVECDLYPELKAAVVSSDIKGFGTIERGFVDITCMYK